MFTSTDLVDVFHLQVSWYFVFRQQDAVPGAPVLLTLPADKHQVVEVAAGTEGWAGQPDHLHQVLHVLHLTGHIWRRHHQNGKLCRKWEESKVNRLINKMDHLQQEGNLCVFVELLLVSFQPHQDVSAAGVLMAPTCYVFETDAVAALIAQMCAGGWLEVCCF